MKHYYKHPDHNDLIEYDDESGSITVLELVGSIGQPDEEVPDEEDDDEPDDLHYPSDVPVSRARRKSRTTTTCSNCGNEGHTKRTCDVEPDVDKDEKTDPDKTTKKQRVIDMLSEGMTTREVANEVGCSIGVVHSIKSRNKDAITTPEKRAATEQDVFTPEIREQIKDMRDRDMTTSEIAAELDLPADDVAKISPREEPKAAKKTDRERIQELHVQGLSSEEIAIGLNLSIRQVEEAIAWVQH